MHSTEIDSIREDVSFLVIQEIWTEIVFVHHVLPSSGGLPLHSTFLAPLLAAIAPDTPPAETFVAIETGAYTIESKRKRGGGVIKWGDGALRPLSARQRTTLDGLKRFVDVLWALRSANAAPEAA